MKAFLKAAYLFLLLVCLCTGVKAQREFIDSIRNMLVDLNNDIQTPPVNSKIQHAIPFCTGDIMNDSLETTLKEIISERCIFAQNLLQPVSEHVLLRHIQFIQRIMQYFVRTGPAAEYSLNILNMAIVIKGSALRRDGHLFDKQSQQLLSGIHFIEPFLEAKRLRYMAEVCIGEKPDSAYVFYIQSLQQNPRSTQGEKLLYAETLFLLADFLRTHNKPDSALLLFKQLPDVITEIYGENSTDYAYWLIRVGNMYTYMAKYNMALELDQKALQITRTTIGEKTNQYALCVAEIGTIYYRRGEYAKSLPYTRQALDIKQDIFGNDYFDNVVNLHDLATLYTRMGLYNEAIPLLNESLAISKKYYGEGDVYAFDLHPLAEVYEYMGAYDKALPLYQKALMIQSKISKANFHYPRTLHSTACLFTKLGQYDKAIDLFKQTLLLKKEVFSELNPEYTKTLNSYAEACLLKHDYENALSLQHQSLIISKKLFGETHPDIAKGLYNLAVLYYDQDKLQKAGESCNKALQLQKKILGENHPDVATSYDLLGNIDQRSGRYEAAHEYYQQAFETRKNIMNALHPDYTQSLYNLAVINIKEGKIPQAAQLLMQADSASLLHLETSYASLSEEEKLTYLHNREMQFQYLPSLLYLGKINSPDIVNRVYQDIIALKSMILFHQQQVYNSIRKSGDSTALQLYNQWRFNKAFLGRQVLLPPEKRAPGFDNLQDATLQLERQLSGRSLTFRNNAFHNATNAKTITRYLLKNEAAIEFIRFRLYKNNWTDSIIYAAVVLLPGKDNAMFIPLFEEKQLQSLMQFSNNHGEAAINYLYPPGNKQTGVSARLYKLIWQPLQRLPDSINYIYYSPCGLLYKVSFAALLSGNSKQLIEKYSLKQLLSTKILSLAEENKIEFRTASLWGGIDYDITFNSTADTSSVYNVNNSLFNGAANVTDMHMNKPFPAPWQALPGTKKETEKILLLLNSNNIYSELKTGAAATEETFKKMDGTSPELIHIATHGFFLTSINTLKPNKEFLYETNLFTDQQNPMFRSGLLLQVRTRPGPATSQIRSRRTVYLRLTKFHSLTLAIHN